MAEYCPGSVVFFAIDELEPVLANHRAAGGRAVFVRNNAIILADGPQEEMLLSLERAPLTHGGRIRFQVENTLAAVAAAWSLGIPLDLIRTRVESFAANMEMAPGRFNLLDINGATVIIDYGHNASSLQSLWKSWPSSRTSIARPSIRWPATAAIATWCASASYWAPPSTA